MNRREMIRWTSLGLGVAALYPLARQLGITESTSNSFATPFRLIGGGNEPPDMYAGDVKPNSGRLRIFNHPAGKQEALTGIVTEHHVPYHPHHILLHPTRQDRCVAFPLKHDVACDFDPGHPDETLRPIAASPGLQFYGHGVYSGDGKTLFTAEDAIDGSSGKIIVRDAETLQILETYSSFGSGPHEMKWMHNGTILAICNGDENNRDQSNIAFIDTQSGRLLKKHVTPDASLRLRHMEVLDPDHFIIGTQIVFPKTGTYLHTRPIPVMGSIDGGLEMIAAPQESLQSFEFQLLSMAIAPNKKIVAFTCPAGNSVTVWDLQKKKLLQVLKHSSPTGIVWDEVPGRFLFTTSMDHAAMNSFSYSNLWGIHQSEEIPFQTGSHLTYQRISV